MLGRIKRVFGFCFRVFFLSQKSFTLCSLSLEPFDQISFDGVLRPFLNNVDGGTILEPNDKEIVSHDIDSDNIYQRIVSVMKQSTQEYYNMRIVLGLKCA